MKKTILKNKIFLLNKELFYFLSFAIILFFLLEVFLADFILIHFNINFLLFFWFASIFLYLSEKK